MKPINVFFSFLIASSLAVVLPAAEKAGTPRRPNILRLIGENLVDLDLGCYGEKLVQTPNLDRLATDPHEIHNLVDSDQPEHREALQRLRTALQVWIAETGDLGQWPEPRDTVAPFEKEMHDWFGTPGWYRR